MNATLRRPGFQVLLAAAAWVGIVTLTARRPWSDQPPGDLKALAGWVERSVDVAALRYWADDVLSARATGTEIPSLPRFLMELPAPCAPWSLWPETDAETRPDLVELLSLGGFGSYALVIGPPHWTDDWDRSERVAAGVFVRRSP